MAFPGSDAYLVMYKKQHLENIYQLPFSKVHWWLKGFLLAFLWVVNDFAVKAHLCWDILSGEFITLISLVRITQLGENPKLLCTILCIILCLNFHLFMSQQLISEHMWLPALQFDLLLPISPGWAKTVFKNSQHRSCDRVGSQQETAVSNNSSLLTNNTKFCVCETHG